jgi:hypothetical protein
MSCDCTARGRKKTLTTEVTEDTGEGRACGHLTGLGRCGQDASASAALQDFALTVLGAGTYNPNSPTDCF